MKPGTKLGARLSSLDSKRINLNTMVAPDTYKGLDQIAKDQGLGSKGRAIDWLVEHAGCIPDCPIHGMSCIRGHEVKSEHTDEPYSDCDHMLGDD